MKKYLLIILIITLSGCSRQMIQLIETGANNSTENNGQWVFENDTVKITYSFWADKGVLAFSVFNKIDKPIYIDWKNSSLILVGNKLDYWIDAEQTNAISFYKGYYYSGKPLVPGLAVSAGTSTTSTTSVKPERVTFIPPKSSYSRSQFYLLPIDYFQLNPNCEVSIEKRNDNPKKNTTVSSQTFDENNSPFKFRNYIAVSFSETSIDYMFIDNGFYMKSIKEMDSRHFKGKNLGCDQDGYLLYQNPYKKGTSFFIIKIDQPSTSTGGVF
jgi:hypothetical protein